MTKMTARQAAETITRLRETLAEVYEYLKPRSEEYLDGNDEHMQEHILRIVVEEALEQTDTEPATA